MNDNLCSDCYKEDMFLPFSAFMKDAVSMAEMKDYLKSTNHTVSNETRAHELQEMYEMSKIQESGNKEEDKNKPLPVCQSKSLDVVRNDDERKFKFGRTLHTFDLDHLVFSSVTQEPSQTSLYYLSYISLQVL